MRKAGKVLLTVFACSAVLLSGCMGKGNDTRAEERPELEAFPKETVLAASFTDSRLQGMKGIADNGTLRLLADETTGSVAVVHTASGEVWHSNPPARDEDPIASGVNKDLLSSQIIIDYYNAFGQTNQMNSHSDSAAHGQIALEAIPDGVRVHYQFGTAKRTLEEMPLQLSEERFGALSADLDKTLQRALLIAYRQDKDTGIWTRNDAALVGLQLERALTAIDESGYSQEDLEADMQELGFTQTIPETRTFRVTLEYVLDGNDLVATVPASGIFYPDGYPIYQLSVLGFFGAGDSTERGSLLVPDGSGALIHFNNAKTQYNSYQQTVYGTDRTMDTLENPASEEKVRLPVFGIIREGAAFLGIIEKGDSVATIKADVAGKLNSFNYVYPSFTVINKGDVTLNASQQQRSLPKFQEHPSRTDFAVRYSFLHGDAAQYAGMADSYRSYLADRYGLEFGKGAVDQENVPFYLELIGGIQAQKYIAGIPYKATEPLTTFDQAQTIVERLLQEGVGNIKLKYSGWFNEGLHHTIPEKLKVDSGIGGRKGLERFSSFAGEHGVELFPDVALLTAYSTSGFSKSADAARTLRGVPAALYPLDIAMQRRDRTWDPSYIVSPRLVEGYAKAVTDQAAGFGLGSLSLRDLADQLDSDYRKNEQIDRAGSAAVSVESFRMLRDAGLGLMADGGNAYALPYLSQITNAPMFSSGFKIEDESIPFYQLVVRGLAEYTGQPYNLSTYTNERQYLLKCLEYGSGLSFKWIHEPNYAMKDTEFNNLYAVHYGLGIETAIGLYTELNDVLGKVQGEAIALHEKLDEGVYKTVYGNGVYVIVNYNLTPVTVEGVTIEAESYKTGGGLS